MDYIQGAIGTAKSEHDGISLSALVIIELIQAVQEKGASFRFQARGYSMTPATAMGMLLPSRR